MKTVLIVDDEYYIRKRVCNCIDWKEFGYAIEEAEDGRLALELLTDRYIELAVIDISMPNIDGLRLAEEIKNLKLDTRVIILTGYEKFEYAKAAIKSNVDFYLLKPVDEEEMIDAVVSINKKIDKMNEEKQKLQQSIEHQHQSEMLLKSIFFKTLFAENINKKSRFTEDQLLDYQIDINMPCCVVIYDIIKDNMFFQPMEKHLWENAAANILYESISKNFKLVITADIFAREILIINLPPDQMDPLHDALSSAYENVWNNLNCITVFSCSKIAHTSIKGIIKAYKEAEATHLLRIFDDSSQKIHSFSNSNVTVIDSDIQNALREIDQILKSYNIPIIKEKTHALVLLLKAKKVSYYDLELILNHLILIAQRVCYSDGNSINSNDTDIVTAHEILRRCDCLSDFEDEILTIFNAVTNKNSHITVVSGAQIRNKVDKLIETHYNESRLTVDFLAKKLFLNPAYLSSTYKKYSGITIMQYITQCRMEQAKILLDKLNFNISQIAEMVGYNDAFHFSKRFKQYFGLPPSSFKRTL